MLPPTGESFHASDLDHEHLHALGSHMQRLETRVEDLHAAMAKQTLLLERALRVD